MDYCCSEGSLRGKIIYDLNKTPDLSQRPPQNCPKCENPVDGHYCQGCALLRKKFKKDLFTDCIENGIFKDFQDTLEPSNDNTNVVNTLQGPFVVKQNPSKNFSQSLPQINHHCCYGCGDPLEDIFCHQCTCELCGRGAIYGYNCPPKVLIIPNLEPCNNQTVDELPQTVPSFDLTYYSEDGNSFTYGSKSNIVDDSLNVFNPPPQTSTYSYEFCGNDANYGHDCPLQVPFTYDPEPCYNQDFNFLQNFQIFQQQYLCCTRCGGPHETCQCDQLIFDEPYCENCKGSHMSFQCQPMNQNHYEPNLCYNSNSFSFDQFQPSQFPVIHQPIREKTCAELLAEEHEANINTQPFQYYVVPQPPQEEISVEFLQEKRNQISYVKSFLRKFNRISFYKMPKVLSLASETILEIEHALEDKHCQPKDIQELFQRLHNDVQNIHEELAVYINAPSWDRPTVCYNNDDDEDCTIAITPILSPKELDNSLSIRDEHLDTVSAIESDTVIKSSVKNLVQTQIDSLFDEFVGKLTLLKSIPPGINETDCDPEEETRLIKRLLCDNSSPRPLEEFIYENYDTAIESFSLFPIPIKDSDSFMEEIDLSFTPNDSMSPSIEEDKYNSKRDILILEELLSNDSLLLLKNESFHFDIPSSPRPSTKPLDGNSGILNVKVMGDIYEHKGHEASQSSTKCSMMIYGRNIPILDVQFLHFYPP
nr:hypothetical protein [Tanacetum cinerariifolium]